LIVWPQMAVCAGIAVFATILRAWVGADDYIIKDVKGHATLGTALAFLTSSARTYRTGGTGTVEDSSAC
jgi:hypothetical protein